MQKQEKCCNMLGEKGREEGSGNFFEKFGVMILSFLHSIF